MSYAKNLGALAHSNGEVRLMAKEMTVSLQKQVGTDALEGYLKVLRPKQLEEYKVAFGEGGGMGDISARSHEDASAPRKVKQLSSHNVTHSPGGKVNTAANRVDRGKGREGVDASVEDFTLCSFCGKDDKGWNEDALDMHYWKDCPLLCPCPACAQVVEIAGLPDHLLSECEFKAKFATCEVTGLAIRINEFESWSRSATCKPPPTDCMYCPLCLATVEDSDEAWKEHLVYGCPQNPRSRSSGK